MWRGSVEKSDKHLREKVNTILNEIELVISAEEQEDVEDSFKTLSTEDFKNRVERISKKSNQDRESSKDLKKHIRHIVPKWRL